MTNETPPVNTNGSSPHTDGSADAATSTEYSIDQKLDCIMEAVAFQSKLLASALIAFDKKLQKEAEPKSKLIKPHGSI